MLQEINIPKKSLFKLEEVCSLTGVKPYVLRFWESEFDEISPILSSTGQKVYEHKDIEAVIIIKELLFDKKMTIDQAKAEVKIIRNSLSAPISVSSQVLSSSTASINENMAKSNQSTVLKMELSHLELQKLGSAKLALSTILERIKTIKSTNHWG